MFVGIVTDGWGDIPLIVGVIARNEEDVIAERNVFDQLSNALRNDNPEWDPSIDLGSTTQNGKRGVDFLQTIVGGKAQEKMTTNWGKTSIPDLLVGKVAVESKVGGNGFQWNAELQLSKYIELRESGKIDDVIYVFFQNANGRFGFTPAFGRTVRDFGFSYIVWDP
ncbi:MAG: hypothetical protein HY297_04230 [Thaumarchaeota archaeon]|nr:hypothetical protein [Nitrososphaerota archaeon]